MGLGIALPAQAEESTMCLSLTDTQMQADCTVLHDALYSYAGSEIAPDYEFYLEDMAAAPYAELRFSDAVAVLRMFEEDGVLSAEHGGRDNRRVLVSILAWFATEQTAGGASVMETAIVRLHRIAPETTKRAIAFVALTGLEDLGGQFSPWGAAVSLLDDYEVSIRGVPLRPIP